MRMPFLVVLLGSAAWAWSAPASALEVVVRPLDGPQVRGHLKAFTQEGLVVGGQTVPWSTVRDVRNVATPPDKPAPAHWRAWLIGDELLHGTLGGPALDGDGISFKLLRGGSVILPLEAVMTLEYVPSDAAPCHDLLEGAPGQDELDILYDAGGDAVRGTVVAVTAKTIDLEDQRGKTRSMPWRDLRVLRLANERLAAEDAAWFEVELMNGTRLQSATVPTWGARAIRMRTRSLPDATIELPTAAVRAVRSCGGAYVWASRLPFTTVVRTHAQDHADLEVAKILNARFGVRVDRRVKEVRDPKRQGVCPLRVGGTAYRHGFAVHAHSEITIRLDKKYASFRTQFGIDDGVFEARPDATGDDTPRGNVDAQILCDGKEVWRADSVKGGDKPLTVKPIDVAGVTELVLVVGFGPDKLWTLDRANWLEPILVRAK